MPYFQVVGAFCSPELRFHATYADITPSYIVVQAHFPVQQ